MSRVLIACEFSGIVRDAFAAHGHDAWSCDLLPTMNPGNHIQNNVLNVLNQKWDLMIAHPPCTYLCSGSAGWMKHIGKSEYLEKQKEALSFVMELANSRIPKIAIENPIGRLSGLWRKPDQICYAYQFGASYTKDICFWLKKLPPLLSFLTCKDIPKKLDFWSGNRRTKEGWCRKSITFPEVAKAMADQWGPCIE